VCFFGRRCTTHGQLPNPHAVGRRSSLWPARLAWPFPSQRRFAPRFWAVYFLLTTSANSLHAYAINSSLIASNPRRPLGGRPTRGETG
jgi:hypothetical protein